MIFLDRAVKDDVNSNNRLAKEFGREMKGCQKYWVLKCSAGKLSGVHELSSNEMMDFVKRVLHLIHWFRKAWLGSLLNSQMIKRERERS